MTEKPLRIVVYYDHDGVMSIYTEKGLAAEVLSICEPAPGDRVYCSKPRVLTAAEIDEMIGDSPIGQFDDERSAALAARIEEAMTGKPRLFLVPSEEVDA